MIVMRILNIFKRKRFDQESRLERIRSSYAKTISSKIEKLVLTDKRSVQMEEEKKVWTQVDGC